MQCSAVPYALVALPGIRGPVKWLYETEEDL